MTLGQKLKQTRLARGMTQSQVVGDRITRNMLSQIENDLASPSVGTLEYLASVLNVRLSWLLADEQEEAEAGRTQRLRELLKSGEYAACLELAPEHAPDDEQALALAMAAAQCAQRALESERFDTARHLAQRGLAWNNGSLYASAALMLHLWDILARCAQSAGPGQEEAAFADYRQAYAAQPVRARYQPVLVRSPDEYRLSADSDCSDVSGSRACGRTGPGSKSRRKAGRGSRSRHSHDLARARDSTLGFCEERQGARHWRCCGQRCGERRRRRGDLRGIRCQGIWSAGDRSPHADAGDRLRTQFEDRRSDG